MSESEIKKLSKRELLTMLADKEMEYLRKKILKYKRCSLLIDDVEFYFLSEAKDFKENMVGVYEYDEEKLIHRIYIDDNLLEMYPHLYKSRNIFARWNVEDLRDTIRHELLHAYVKERYRYVLREIKYANADASPIFLAYLQYLNVPSGHNVYENYKHSDLFKKVEACNNFNEFEDMIFIEVFKLKEVTRKMERLKVEGIEVKLMFTHCESGLINALSHTFRYAFKVENKLKITEISVHYFKVGCNVNSETLEEEVLSKINNARKDNYENVYISTNKLNKKVA